MVQGMPDVVFAFAKPTCAMTVLANLTHEFIQLPLGVGEVNVLNHGSSCKQQPTAPYLRHGAAMCNEGLVFIAPVNDDFIVVHGPHLQLARFTSFQISSSGLSQTCIMDSICALQVTPFEQVLGNGC
jgi:hypothetical protein